MKTKQGISLMVLVITIVVSIIIAGLVIVQTENVIFEAEKDQFVTEISTIKDKVKEYYLLTGALPVKPNVSYTGEELKEKIIDDTYKYLLENEIEQNKDINNTFLVVDLNMLQVQTDERGIIKDDTDIYIVATNTLNVYYLKGFEYDDTVRFSTVYLAPQNEVAAEIEQEVPPTELNNDLDVVKNTTVWTNEIILTIKNNLKNQETLQYSIGGADLKIVDGTGKIVINSSSMTEAEITAFTNNKYVVINRLINGSVTETKQIDISNLDIITPSLGEMEIIDTTNENYNIIKINSADEGGSGIKCIYYDYNTMLVDDMATLYYSNSGEFTAKALIGFGKITNDGTMKLEKHIKSIVAIAVDNAGNVSDINTYTIEDKYLVSK